MRPAHWWAVWCDWFERMDQIDVAIVGAWCAAVVLLVGQLVMLGRYVGSLVWDLARVVFKRRRDDSG